MKGAVEPGGMRLAEYDWQVVYNDRADLSLDEIGPTLHSNPFRPQGPIKNVCGGASGSGEGPV